MPEGQMVSSRHDDPGEKLGRPLPLKDVLSSVVLATVDKDKG